MRRTAPTLDAAAPFQAEALLCRSCGTDGLELVVDLGVQPLANSNPAAADLMRMEPHYPLIVHRCPRCHLVQVPAVVPPEDIFSDYLYFSSYSDSWLAHARAYCTGMIERFGLGPQSLVVEIASNDGYLLQYMVERGVPVLGIEPAANVARVAEERGVPTLVAFFGRETARRLVAEGRRADLTAANNVLAHVPDLNDFIAGFKILLKDTGVATFEFPHLVRMVEENQFDTIYHEHFSYISLLAADAAFRRHGLVIFDVEELPTHGGSLRIHATHAERGIAPSAAVRDLLARERAGGYDGPERFAAFSDSCVEVKSALLEFLIKARREGKRVVGYGAPAKGNTLLNFCGVRREYVAFTVDRSPHKQGRYLPGTHIPVYAPEAIMTAKPDYVLVLPWNLKDEIVGQMAGIREWGGRFVVAVPRLTVF
jgi:SAM-dependent methyltransferase